MNNKLRSVVVVRVEQRGGIIALINDEQKVRRRSNYERFKPMKG
jgi:hypothetical protein